jgi:hypothetical protein
MRCGTRRRDGATPSSYSGVLLISSSPEAGRSAQYCDEVLGAIDSDITAEVASGTFGLRDDLELPDLPKREPPRDRAAAERRAQAPASIDAAEARVSRARDGWREPSQSWMPRGSGTAPRVTIPETVPTVTS